MKQDVNYIKHHKGVNLKLMEDDLSAHHISLYNALFLIWNECSFDTELSINRNDVMKLSKIGSANTYTKALHDLDEKGYLKYTPSYNPLKGSKVNLYRFDKGTDKGSVKGGSKGSDNGTDNGGDTLYKQGNPLNPLNKETDAVPTSTGDPLNGNPKKEAAKFTPPPIEDVIDFFIEKGYSEIAAKKAFNYYSVANWSDSKGNKIKNWKQKMIGVWFKDENKPQVQPQSQFQQERKRVWKDAN